MPVSGGRRKQILNVSAGKLSHPLTYRFFLPVAFGHEVCEPEDRAFSNETTSSPDFRSCSNRFNRGRPPGVTSKIRCRADLRLSGSPSRRGPLHPSTAERRNVAEISAQLPRVARFQPPLLHSERGRRVDRKIRDSFGRRCFFFQAEDGIRDLRPLPEASRRASRQDQRAAQTAD